ncbi:hypothetical protein QBC35DRAFT_476408 [Podospora australis]|uniref:Protein kinase domain-containing protein n=1 Tax=Podospora australis TaxID=1536484 RepID=A0AAN6WS14_9PEZI|nr:hypothetical protein QBC35DRAFT_476408 [Podospora australis]
MDCLEDSPHKPRLTGSRHVPSAGRAATPAWTGFVTLFLQIKEDDPRTLYYALVTPDEEADSEDGAVRELETAVAQVASFCLLAFRSMKRTKTWITEAQNSLCQWPIPHPEMEYQTTDEEGEESAQPTQSSDQSFDAPSTISVPLPRLKRPSRSTCNPGVGYDGGRYDSDDDNGHMPQDPARSAPEGSGTRSKRKEAPSSGGSRSSSGTFSEKGGQTRQYCTQACLLGLKRGGKLDEACPNVSSHRATTGDGQHPIQAGELGGVWQTRSEGTLFKLTLARYGYTFVGKGTVSENVPYLLHEGKVYELLERLQGELVPVFLGNMNLVEPYHLIAMNSYYFTGARIVHMLLMSWVGEEAARMSVPGLAAEVARLSRAVLDEGVAHGDEREANILWSEERSRVMLVDFDRAVFLLSVKHKRVRSLLGKKRKREDVTQAKGPRPKGPRTIVC